MTRIIAVANQKGGVGKTTTSVNLSASLATMSRRVLLADLDPQGNATMGCGIDKYQLEVSTAEVLTETTDINRVIQPTRQDNLHVLPSNADLTAAEIALLELPEREQRLSNQLQKINTRYDYILIDCPPALNILTLNAFVAARSVLIPIQCEYYALEGLTALLQTIEDVRQAVNPDLETEGLLRTMFDTRNNLALEVSRQLMEHFPDDVFDTIVPRNIRLAEAPSFGQSIVEYDRTSRGALAYLALAGELIRRQQLRTRDQAGHAAAAQSNGTDSAATSMNPNSSLESEHG